MRDYSWGTIGLGCAILIAMILFVPWLVNTLEGILRTQYALNIPDISFGHWFWICFAIRSLFGATVSVKDR